METIPLGTGAEVTGVLLDEHNSWALDLELMRNAIRPTTRLIAVNFPNNPTGYVPDAATFRELVELCDERGIKLFCDEVYRGLELDQKHTLPQAADLSERAISLNVMSKAYGLGGLRVGWLACRERTTLERLERRKHYTTICNSVPSEYLATIALHSAEAIKGRNRGIIAANLPLFSDFFARWSDRFDWEPPTGGCVCFPRYKGADGVERFCRELVEQAGVLLLPSSIYRSDLVEVPHDHFRIGVGRSDPAPALEAFDRFLEGR
jgi:aspartate/methionine/tyrosine aminotransferase